MALRIRSVSKKELNCGKRIIPSRNYEKGRSHKFHGISPSNSGLSATRYNAQLLLATAFMRDTASDRLKEERNALNPERCVTFHRGRGARIYEAWNYFSFRSISPLQLSGGGCRRNSPICSR